MKEITCPNCHTTFKMEGSEYAEIIAQIRDELFESELKSSIQNSVQAKENELKSAYQKELSAKDQQIIKAQGDYQNHLSEAENEKKALQLELDNLNERLKAVQEGRKTSIDNAVNQARLEKDLEIQSLKSQIQSSEMDKRLAVQNAEQTYKERLVESQNSIAALQQSLIAKESAHELALRNTEDRYKEIIKFKEDEIARYKEFKTRLSTKLIGESLEQHCQNEFNKLRATAFPHAEFDKDNDASGGSKGDFIFRDYDGDVPYISIMFEMKNEMDEDVSRSKKHKNEDFFDKLDKDRNEKGCEYAVLVSMLEPDSELYNTGIVDVSYKHKKMYVIRPQFFIPIITILRDAARNTISYKRDLIAAQAQNIDIENFKKRFEDFKDSFGYNCDQVAKKFEDAIKDIDKSIKDLENTKKNLEGCLRNLNTANNKVEDMTVKKLTKDSPSLRAQLGD